MSKLRVACTAISKAIYAGRVNKAGTDFIGEPLDVTSDVLKAIIDKVGAGNTIVVRENGVPAFEISVRTAAAQNPAPAAVPAQAPTEGGVGTLLTQARDALNGPLLQFTRTPSTLRDSNARVRGHEAVSAIEAALQPPQPAPAQ